ncbi:MAG: NAD(P)H-dependent oxidoreductase subunit E [Planctomycetes bacterium]|nr:NAD(P)H-dependent oxidoreductase subunit E [Planctomycetota bacterium]
MNPSVHTDSKPHEEGRAGSLIASLEEIQARYGYLPQKALLDLHKRTGSSLVDIYGVATFYRAFSLKPRGKHLISVCLGTACHVNRAPVVAREVERLLNVKAGETTADREFTLETVNCLGACALGPVVVVDGHYFPAVTTSRVGDILQSARVGLNNVKVETDERVFPLEVSCARCNHSLMDPTHPIDGHPSIRVTVSFDNQHGWTALSCLYGSYNVASEYEIPDDTVVNMFCPHCHAELLGGGSCMECGSPMVPMIVRSGGIVQICTRRGCLGHMLDLSGAIVH